MAIRIDISLIGATKDEPALFTTNDVDAATQWLADNVDHWGGWGHIWTKVDVNGHSDPETAECIEAAACDIRDTRPNNG